MTDGNERMASAVHIICPLYNGARHLAHFLESVRRQGMSNWLLWLRDDGSTDDSSDTARAFASRDERIRLLNSDASQLGAVGAFSWLLQRVPEGAPYIMFADQDDEWLPDKIEHTLSAMTLAESTFNGPVLVHTDMTVVDESLATIDSSFWHFAHIDPEPASLRRLSIHNVVTGATVMMNRALRERVGAIPAEAAMHDAWVACVASAFGHVVAVATPTMLYRQHGTNTIGARQPVSALRGHKVAVRATTAFARSNRLVAHVNKLARQAGAFVARYGAELNADDFQFLSDYAAIPSYGMVRRKAEIARLHLRPEFGWLRNAGWLFRA